MKKFNQVVYGESEPQIKINTVEFALHRVHGVSALVEIQELPENHFRLLSIKNMISQVRDSLLNQLQENHEDYVCHLAVSNADGTLRKNFLNHLNESLNLPIISERVIREKLQEIALKTPGFERALSWQSEAYVRPLSYCLFKYIKGMAEQNELPYIFEVEPSHLKSTIEKMDPSIPCKIHYGFSQLNDAIEMNISEHFKKDGDIDHLFSDEVEKRHRNIFNDISKTLSLIKQSSKIQTATVYLNSSEKIKVLHSGKSWPEVEMFNQPELSYTPYKKLWFTGANQTADLVLLAMDKDQDLCVALIQRATTPFQGKWALPGGFVDTVSKKGEPFKMGMETPKQAALREFEEETLGKVDQKSKVVEIGFYDHPLRDPRNSSEGWVVSTAFMAKLEQTFPLKKTEETMGAQWVKVKDIQNGTVKLAFDHQRIFNDGIGLLNQKNLDKKIKSNRKNKPRTAP